MSKSYRPEIDGLRSLAVLGVLFYHAEIVFQSFRIFPGGFLGVDLFFVISGYLITLLILKEYQSNNKFSFKNFYIRRAKRILPALILIIFVSSIFSYYYLLPIYFEEFIKSVTSSFFFFSNIFFHYSAQAYGAQALTKVPLLHTWSLSLEEQFYFLYPIFLIGILFFIKKGIKIILILGIIFSLIFATLINIDHQSFNFYMLPSRIWELLFGALLGVDIINVRLDKHRKIKEILAVLGFLIILCSFSLFKNTNNHPTYLTLIPVIGAYLVIQDTNKKSFLNKILSLKILTNLGLISYSLYLWHHPIFSFAKIFGIEEKDLLIKFLLIFLSIFLAIFTYRYIEKPFREKNEKIFKLSKIIILGITMVLITVSLNFFTNFQKKQYPAIAHQLHDKTWLTTRSYFRPCFQRKFFFCSFNEKNNNKTVFLVGDSILASIQEELRNTLVLKNFNFVSMTNAGCDLLNIDKKKSRSVCNQKILDNKEQKILEKKEATIILHLNYTREFRKDQLIEFLKSVQKYLNKNYKVILIYPIPQMKENTSSRIEKNINKKKFPVDIVNINFSDYLKESKKVFDLFDTMEHKNLYKTYPHKIFCDSYLKDKCIGNTSEHIYFVDVAHLSKEGSKIISMDMIRIIDRIY
jgi:peptidoglycan/LPS O-acetylase OafA/YrhL